MQREIKFRAWEKNRKEMLEVLGVFFDVGTIKHKPLKIKGNTNPFNEGYPNTYFRDIEVMQYTGLKDKNGKEIYEGDIVEFPIGNGDLIKQQVVFQRGAFTTESGRMWGYEKDTLYLGWYEVIGNIYENPELLTADNPSIETLDK